MNAPNRTLMLGSVALVIGLLAGSIAVARAQDRPAADPTIPRTSASIMNPAISVIGWFQGVSGNDAGVQDRAFELREAEVGLQSRVDPFTRADFFVSLSGEGAEIEEGYITWLALPGSGQAKAGKIRADLGKFNRTHPPETPFADRPLAALAFLGEEGLSTTGLSLSALLPNPFDLYWDVVANVGAAPEESPLFEARRRSDLLAVARTSAFVPIGEASDVHLGVSYASGPAAPDLRVHGARVQLGTADLTYRWKNPRRSIYRSLMVQAEYTIERGSASGAGRLGGGFAYAIYQFARQWKLGGRYDWTELPGSDTHESGVLALLSYRPSEFSVLSLQGRRVRDDAGVHRDTAFFKWTFNIGPHGADPY